MGMAGVKAYKSVGACPLQFPGLNPKQFSRTKDSLDIVDGALAHLLC